MKKILLLIAIGVCVLDVKAQTIDIYYEKNTDLKFVGDTISFWIDAPKAIINKCIARVDNSDITNTFFFDYFDSKGKSHYKQIAVKFPDRGVYCRTTQGQFQGNASYQGTPTGIEGEIILKIDKEISYYTIQGVMINNPTNYGGVMIHKGKIMINNQ